MKKLILLVLVTALVTGFGMKASGDYYEFSAHGGSGSEYEVDSYGNTIYYGAGASVYSVDVSIADMSKKDEPRFLVGADGIYGTADDLPNPNYQTRTFSNEQSIPLGVPAGYSLKGASIGEMWVDAASIYTIATDGSIIGFNKTTGAHTSTMAYASGLPSGISGWGTATLLSYGDGQWWMGDENRRVYSSADGSNWSHEFDWSATSGGSHGDGLEYVGGNVWVSDMTSNWLMRWGYGDDPATDGVTETGWNEWNRFSYLEEAGGTGKAVEGMGFGAFDHFWAGSGNYIYELGGGDIQSYIPPDVIPAPGAIVLGSIGAGLVGWLRRRRSL